MYEIYLITNRANGKVYVGQTCCGLERRWDQHRQNAHWGSKKCPHFYNAIRSHGPDNFSAEVLESVASKEEADASEIRLISELRATEREFGYNQMGGGEGGFLHSEETKEKMSKTATGRVESEETKRKVSSSHKAKNKAFVDSVSYQEVTELYRAGASVSDLCKNFGVALNLVGQKLREGGVQIATVGHAARRAERLIREGKEHLINPDNNELARLYESGLSIMKLGEMYEIGFQSVYNRLEKVNPHFSRRNRGKRATRAAQVVPACSESVVELGPEHVLGESCLSLLCSCIFLPSAASA